MRPMANARGGDGRSSARSTLALGVLLAAAVLAGCGSSSSVEEPGPPTTTRGPSPAPSTGKTSPSGSSLRVASRPNFPTPPKSEPVQSGTVQIAYRNITARPVTLRVKTGTTVRFTNYDSVVHNATSIGGPQKFASGDFGEGESFAVKLTRPGIVHFECTIHPATINGAIEVLGG